jgi:diguanylate cyclase (GGDEF)-like protein
MTNSSAPRRRKSAPRRRNTAPLPVDNALLRMAVQQLPHGMCMFDANERLVLANPHCAEIWGLPEDILHSGKTFSDILAETRGREVECNRAAPPAPAGSAGVRRREWLMDDGRTIDIVVTRLADGACVALHEDITVARQAEAQIAFLARHDSLTRLPNRGAMRDHLETMLKRHARGEPLAVMCLDLDHFKAVNDLFGHPAGDALLCQVADRLRTCARETDIVARLGGDEFAILQCGTPQPTSSTALAQRIIKVLGQVYELDGRRAQIGASVGIALAPHGGLEPDTLLKNADMALYEAKAGGRGTFRYFDPNPGSGNAQPH